MLGIGVYELFSSGATGCMVYVDASGKAAPLYLEDLQGSDGKIPPRLVDIEGYGATTFIKNNLQFVEPADYEEANKYVDDPEAYDFYKILNW